MNIINKLEYLCARLNKMTGSPSVPWQAHENGHTSSKGVDEHSESPKIAPMSTTESAAAGPPTEPHLGDSHAN